MVAPPPSIFAGLPTIEEITKEANAQNVAGETTQKLEYNIYKFKLNQSKSDKAEDIDDAKDGGVLTLGTFAPHGVTRFKAIYKAPDKRNADHELVESPEYDFSGSVTTNNPDPNDANKIRWVKAPNATSEWTFDITIKNYGSEKPVLTGWFTNTKGKFYWDASFLGKFPQSENLPSVFSSTPPSDENNLKDEHSNRFGPDAVARLSPIQSVTSGHFIAGSDAAQTRGDEIMVKIMMNALDEDTKKLLYPERSKLPSLNEREQAILTECKDFFERGAVHYVSDMLRKADKVKEELRNRLKENRYSAFLGALTAVKQKPATGTDPVVTYGMSRDNTDQMALLQKLAPQYQTAIMKCYEEGYKLQVPAWDRFTKEPVFWFETLCNYYRTDTFLDPWKTKTAAENVFETTASEIGHKLSLLKHAAMADSKFSKDGEKLTVETTMNFLQGEHLMSLSYQQIIDDDLKKNVTDLINQILDTPPSTEVQEELKKRKDYSDEVHKAMLKEALDLISKANNHDSKLAIEAREYWEKRSPPGTKLERLTVGQLIESWETDDRLKFIRSQDNMPPFEDSQEPVRKSLWEKVKSGAKTARNKLVTLMKGIFHFVAIAGLIVAAKIDGSSMNAAEEGRLVSALLVEGLNAVGYVGRKVLNYLWSKGQVFKRAIGWFNDSIRAGTEKFVKRVARSLAGSIGKLMRTIGLIGAIFNCISAYWDMQHANELHEDDALKERIYTRIQFSLGCIEAVVIVTEIVAELAGATTLAAVCGPLAIGIAVVGIVVMVVYAIWFAPDPDADIKHFIDGPASKLKDTK